MNIKLVEKWMKKTGWNHTALAAHFQVHPTTLWRRLTGKVTPNYTFLVVLSKMMKTTIEELRK